MAQNQKIIINQIQEKIIKINNQIKEIENPLNELKAKILFVKQNIITAEKLKETDYSEYTTQGGDRKLNKFKEWVKINTDKTEILEIKTKNQIDQLSKERNELSNLLNKEYERKRNIKEKQRERMLKGEIPINLTSWIMRAKWQYNLKFNSYTWKIIWTAIGLAQKREKQILGQIMTIYSLRLIQRKEMTKYYADKYKKYRFSLYKRGYYLIPVDSPISKIRKTQEN